MQNLNPELVKEVTKSKLYFDYFLVNCLGYKDLSKASNEYKELVELLENDKTLFKMILMPRHTFKSSICTIGYSMWRLVNNPDLRIMIYSDAASKAEGFLSQIQNHILGRVAGSKFRELFGALENKDKQQKWNNSEIVLANRKTAHPESSVDTGGIETSKVGKHYDIIIFDDIVSDKNVTTKDQMDKVAECYQKSLSLLKPGGEVIVTGTRWHFGDLYGRLIEKNKQTHTFKILIKSCRDGDKLLFDRIGLNRNFLDQQKREQGSYIFSCNPFEAPIIMGDFSAKPIGEVKENDEVIGWVRNERNINKLVRSKVLKIQSREADVVKMKLESGRKIRCTPDHNWWTNRCDDTHREYKPASVGSRLMYIFEPYLPELSKELNDDAKWLGGFFDGEGSCTGSIILNQSRVHNPEVCDKLESVLDKLDFCWNSAEKPPTKTAWGGNTIYYWINGGIPEKRKFILLCNPSRKLNIEKSILNNGCRFVEEKDRVISIEPDGKETVYALQTETGNYIAWGYGSKNCLYDNNPVDDETAIFKPTNFAFYGDRDREVVDGVRYFWEDFYKTCACDPAGVGEDYTAITVCGTDDKMDMHILEAVNEHIQPSDIVSKIINLAYRYKFKMLGLETNFYRGMLKQELDRAIDEARAADVDFPLFGVEEFKASAKRGEGKENRIRALQPYHERGALKFPGESFHGLNGAFSELAYQMIQFPSAPHDDLLDSLAYHLPLIRKGGKEKVRSLPRNSPAWIERRAWERETEKMMMLPRRLRKQPAQLAFS